MNPVIKKLQKSIDRMEKEKAHKRWPCNYCGSTGKIERYDQGGCVESTSDCQACDYKWHNAGITVQQDKIRNSITLIQEALRKGK